MKAFTASSVVYLLYLLGCWRTHIAALLVSIPDACIIFSPPLDRKEPLHPDIRHAFSSGILLDVFESSLGSAKCSITHRPLQYTFRYLIGTSLFTGTMLEMVVVSALCTA